MTSGTTDYFRDEIAKLGPNRAPEELVQCCLFLLRQVNELTIQANGHVKTRHSTYQKYAVLDSILEKVGKARLTKEEVEGFGRNHITAQACIVSHYRHIYGRGNVITRSNGDGSLSIVVIREGECDGLTAKKGP